MGAIPQIYSRKLKYMRKYVNDLYPEVKQVLCE